MRKFAVAPMLDWTTPQCRVLHRILSSEALLYSEMISTGAILFGDTQRYLQHQRDNPCVLQLGGSNPEELARACQIANVFDYAEINLNVGCPSDRVQNNKIGAILMAEPNLVADCLTAMQENSKVPVSLKHRLGIDDQDESLIFDFIEKIMVKSPCRIFIVHARKAWLKGLSPKENREIPPLNYPLVYEIKKKFPELEIILNGGIKTIAECQQHLQHVDGVMLGRAAYENPQILLEVPQLFNAKSRVIDEIIPKITFCLHNAINNGEELANYTRHLLGLFSGVVGAKRYRQTLSEKARFNKIEVWLEALAAVGYLTY